MTELRTPLVMGPLDKPGYIAEISRDFRTEKHREPYGAGELLHWHRRRINESLRSMGWEVNADLQVVPLGKREGVWR
jgi:hypothetical protein